MGEGTLKWKEVVDVESFERASVALPPSYLGKSLGANAITARETQAEAARAGGAQETRRVSHEKRDSLPFLSARRPSRAFFCPLQLGKATGWFSNKVESRSTINLKYMACARCDDGVRELQTRRMATFSTSRVAAQ